MSSSAAPNVSKCFPFMELHPELRNKVYRELLVSPLPLPALSGKVPSATVDPIGQYIAEDLALHPRILEVSKTVYAEAIHLFYAENQWTTLRMYGWDYLFDIASAFEEGLHSDGIVDDDILDTRWTRQLQDAVAGSLEPDLIKALVALHPPRYQQFLPVSRGFDEGELLPGDLGLLYTGRGWAHGEQTIDDLVIFLRSIGSTNTGLIKRLEIVRDEEYDWTQMSFYHAVLQHYTPNLKYLTIQLRGFEASIRPYPSGWDAEGEFYERLFDQMAFFANFLPSLKSLKVRGGIDEINEMGSVILKRGGSKSRLKWADLEDDWEPLKAKYKTKVNGARVACVCRHHTCHLKAPGQHGWECESLLKQKH